MHCAVSGLGDILVKSDAQAIEVTKKYLAFMPQSYLEKPAVIADTGKASPPDLRQVIPANEKLPFDIKTVIDAIAEHDVAVAIKPVKADQLKELVVTLLGGSKAI